MNKMLVAVGCALVSAFAAFADGENTYPEYDFYLTASDTSTAGNSWNKTGKWSGEWPDDAINKTFYVPAGITLASGGNKTVTTGPWLGGTLTVAGTFSATPSNSHDFGASITNLVLLDDSIYTGGAYGFLRSGSEMTVKAAADHPLTVQYTYPTSGSSYYGRIFTVIHGAPGTGMRFLMTDDAVETSFRYIATAFTDFFGTMTVTGEKINAFQASASAGYFSSPGKLVVTDSALFIPSYPTGTTTANNALLGALEVTNGGIINFRCNTKDTAYVTFGVTNSVKVSDGGIVRVSNMAADKLIDCAESGAANDFRMAVRLAHLTDNAKNQVDVDDAKVEMIGLDEIFNEAFDWKLIVQDNDDGSKELYAGVTNVAVCVKTGTWGAQPDNPDLWAGGVLPKEGVDFYCPNRFNPIKDWDYTNSKIILAGSRGHYWMNDDHATLDLNAKAYYVLESTGFSVYNDGNRRLRGGPLKIVDGATLSFGMASADTQLNIESEVVGNGGLILRNRVISSKYQATLENLNTNWHGRLTVINHQDGVSDGGGRTYTTIVRDARNWGGEFLADADTYSAVTLASNTCVRVLNDVCFTEPTRGFLLNDAPCFSVAEGAKLTLSNQVTYAGIVEKEGEGVLNLGGTARFEDGQAETAPVDGRCGLVVSAGALEVSSQEACDGLQVSFAEGTKLVVSKDCGFYNVKSSNPLTIADEKLPVEIAGFDEKPEEDVEVTVLTLSEAAAANLDTGKFTFPKTKACQVTGFEKRPAGDGKVDYVAKVTCGKGLYIIFR